MISYTSTLLERYAKDVKKTGSKRNEATHLVSPSNVQVERDILIKPSLRRVNSYSSLQAVHLRLLHKPYCR